GHRRYDAPPFYSLFLISEGDKDMKASGISVAAVAALTVAAAFTPASAQFVFNSNKNNVYGPVTFIDPVIKGRVTGISGAAAVVEGGRPGGSGGRVVSGMPGGYPGGPRSPAGGVASQEGVVFKDVANPSSTSQFINTGTIGLSNTGRIGGDATIKNSGNATVN